MKVSITITEPGDYERITLWTGGELSRTQTSPDREQTVTTDGSADLTADVLDAVAFHLRYRDDETDTDTDTDTDTEEQVS